MDNNSKVTFAVEEPVYADAKLQVEGGSPGGGFGGNKRLWIKVGLGVLAFLVICVIVTMIFRSGKRERGSLLGSYIAVIDVSGEIRSEGGATASYDHAWTMNQLDALIDDRSNRGIFLRVDSPGGSVYTSDEIYYKLKEYQKTGRPVYAYFGSQAASGGYYISASCDKIYANRNCWTGSIGVTIGTMYNVSGLLDKMGVSTETITSGRNKSMGSITETLTDEQRAIIQSLIDEAYEQFVEIVAKGRKMSVDEVKALADGRIFSAKQAKEAGLVDEVCNEEKALSMMQRREGLEHCAVQYLQPEKKESLYSLLSTQLAARRSASEMAQYEQLMGIFSDGNKLSIEYKAEIRK